eukprot:TRINITY_DN16143_c0_g1_i1.p1 TRINITY_DN16143_c0_g1~~TRINITY_DN16143_c0_g1_i1.p1  ORF type:complete len:345 (-),score=31.83 TRINITY_DN16143_c0_g1_i1:116-1150(-)
MRLLPLLWACASGCSHFAMENSYGLTVRTMDFESTGIEYVFQTRPVGYPGIRSSKHGYLAQVDGSKAKTAGDLVFAGLNDHGLSCDLNALIFPWTKYPDNSTESDNLGVSYMCQWALEGFASVLDLKEGLKQIHFFGDVNFGAHWALRDASGQGVVIEFLDGKMNVYDDNNDQGKTGFGIMTNEPPLLWQLEALRHLHWKQRLARPSVAMPGAWYPDERFQRIHLVKSGMPQPQSYEEAMMQAVHTLNTITLPMGLQMGTDSGGGSGEGQADRTQYGVIYDHKNGYVYWRSAVNQNLQRLRLQDCGLAKGSASQTISLFDPSLPWFHDAAHSLKPSSHIMTSLV